MGQPPLPVVLRRRIAFQRSWLTVDIKLLCTVYVVNAGVCFKRVEWLKWDN